ncbi:hypothetical protein LMG28138_03774 [Pararobbsia alpina]|uniref:Uncharacterized protein n=1 Tax=Pararobbsia alpina TaxID=621374 RepID=A0A6S7BBW5_9BURK|nr:hypothetical protein LMG28138_03774 [Pararobbsia alpina]
MPHVYDYPMGSIGNQAGADTLVPLGAEGM